MRLRRDERGFTLIELLIVLVILAILVTIGIASYLGMRHRAADAAAKHSLREALPSVHAYHSDNDGWGGMTVAALQAYDQGLSDVAVAAADDDSYCLMATVQGRTWYAEGLPFTISQTSCA